MKKSLLIALITIVILCGLALIGPTHFDTIHAAKSVSGIINSDTTWTKANSPYTLTGPVGVTEGVTLTIETGVTVNLNSYYILLNGTLRAIGSNADKIQFNGGKLTFSQYSSSWNEQTGSGSIIENAILSSSSITIEIWNTAPKINRNSIVGAIWATDGASPIISNNIISRSGYNPVIQISGSPVIFNNTIEGGIETGGYGSTVISNNTIQGGGKHCGIQAGAITDYISDNVISGFQIGIRASVSTIIERNLIINNGDGILMWINANPIIRHNTIANNSNGINLPGYSDGSLIKYHNIQVNYNNFQDNSDYNIYLGFNTAPARDDVNATYNWWGTADTLAISQKIHDSKDDFNLGTVTFTPFLTAPNSEAPPVTSAVTPTPPPETSPTPTPSQEPQQADQTEAIIGAVIVAVVLSAGLGLLIYLIKRK